MGATGTILTKEAAIKAEFPLIDTGRGTQAVHDVVVGYQANRRTGTASTKTKADVSFSGTKPWKQKGTGRARAGYRSSPIWRKGGVAFGPHPRDFSKNLPVKVRRLALKKALSERIIAGEVVLIPGLSVPKPKTKEFTAIMSDLQIEGTALFVNHQIDQDVLKASRNIPDIQVKTSEDVNAEDVLRYDRLIFTENAFAKIAERVNKR